MRPGFRMTSGTRQGCPLSPLIFAVCIDLPLWRLNSKMGEGYVQRPFADDVGVTLLDAPSQLPQLIEIIEEFGRVANVNLQKTIGIPLRPRAEADPRENCSVGTAMGGHASPARGLLLGALAWA